MNNKTLSFGYIRPSSLNLEPIKINTTKSSSSSLNSENNEELININSRQYVLFVEFYNSNKNKQNNLISLKLLKQLISNQKIKKIEDFLIENIFNKIDLDHDDYIDLNEFIDLICIFFFQTNNITHINESILRKYENDTVHNKSADNSLK